MTEISFKGKRISDGVWIHGSHIPSLSGGTFICTAYDHDLNTIAIEEVDSRTVGQFTGFTDVKGKKIFELDEVYDDNIGITVRVLYTSWSGIVVKSMHLGSEYEIPFENMEYLEVVGNCYD